MSNITQYRPHNFEVAKQNINALADSRSRDVELSSFETEGWFFGLNDHKVTGGELNSQLVRPLQKKLTGVTNDIKNLFNVCKQVYTAFESLDKDYIGGIVQGLDKANVASVQALNASQQALNASRENQKTQEGLKRTVLALQQTAEEFKNFRRLADSNINQLRDAISRAENSLNDSLNDFKREVSGYIQRLQSDVTDHARRLDESKSAEETLRRDLTTASDTLKSQGGQIEALQQTATAITEHNGKTDAEIASLKRISPRNAYIIAGAALAISIVHLVLNACGVL